MSDSAKFSYSGFSYAVHSLPIGLGISALRGDPPFLGVGTGSERAKITPLCASQAMNRADGVRWRR